MKKIIFIVLFFISAGNCFAQQVTFQKTIGGTGFEQGNSVQQTSDGGYIIAGTGDSFGGGAFEFYLIKTSINGNVLWKKTFGGAGNYMAAFVQQSADGGYIVVGGGMGDVYLLKTDSNGGFLWAKSFGDTLNDGGISLQQTIDGGYIIAGHTNSFGSGLTTDSYLIKTDSIGNLVWSKTFGGTYYDWGRSAQQTSDGGYILTGESVNLSIGGLVYLIKTDSNGDTLWTKAYDGTDGYRGNSVQQTTDGGYIITVGTGGVGAGNGNVYLIKTNSTGTLQWSKSFEGTFDESGHSVQQTADGGYIIAGYTSSFGAGYYDVYLIKTDSNGNLVWAHTFGGTDDDRGYSVRQTSDGGYIITGYTRSFGAGNTDVYLIKTDSNGNSGCNQANAAPIVTSPAIQVTNPLIVASPLTIVSSQGASGAGGGTVTTLCTTVGIQSAISNPQSEISISPSPTTNNFTITFPNTIHKGSIEIYDVMGKKIFEENIFSISQKEIHLKNSVAGIYFVKVRVYPDLIGNGEEVYCVKLVIE
jgi:type IX secretion system substrate protein